MPFSGVDQEPTFLPDYYLTDHAKRSSERINRIDAPTVRL